MAVQQALRSSERRLEQTQAWVVEQQARAVTVEGLLDLPWD